MQQIAEVTLTLIIKGALSIVGTPLPDAIPGTQYAHQIVASGGVAPLQFALLAGPAWLAIDAQTGMLTGPVPVNGGTTDHAVPVTVQVRDSGGD